MLGPGNIILIHNAYKLLIAAFEQHRTFSISSHEEAETIHNMTAENKLYFQAEKEAIFLILTGIGDEIYSTVDACNTSKEMWTAIERLQQGESLNVQDVKTNLFWEFGKFTSRDGESMESYYSRFYKLMNELTRNNLQVSPMQVNVQFLQQLQPEWSRFVTIVKQRQEIDKVSYHKLFDVLKQFQNEVNDIRSERLARSANPLALLAAAQPYSDNYYQAPKPQRSNAPSYMQSSSTRPSASTRHKGKEIAKPVTPQSESVSEEDSDPEQARRDNIKRTWQSLLNTSRSCIKPTTQPSNSFNSRNKTEDTTPRYNNDNQSGQFGNQRTMTVVGARETVSSGIATKWIQCFNCKLSKLISLRTRMKNDEQIIRSTLQQHVQRYIRRSHLRIQISTVQTIWKQTKQTELEKYTALNDLTSDYKILQTKLNKTLGLLARKDIDIQEGLKTKTMKFQFDIRNTRASQKESVTRSHMKLPDPAKQILPKGEETVTLEKESRSKLDKDKVKP
ncbi:hypothetical protein Tco_0233625 [Tanacetum coccineum]